MNRIILNNKTLAKTILVIGLAAVSFSCDKKKNSVVARGGTSKGGSGIAADSNGSAQAQLQTALKGVGVSIEDIYYPLIDNETSQISVQSTIQIVTPSAQSFPLVTKHSASGSESSGQVTLAQGLVMKVMSRCVGEGCRAYYLLTSLEYNGAIQGQSVGLSFNNDCNFYRDNLPSSKYAQSINDVIKFYEGLGITEPSEICENEDASSSSEETDGGLSLF